MQQADETFLTTTQEPRKLSIAISRYFSGELTEPDLKERYEKFLHKQEMIEKEINRLQTVVVPPSAEMNGFLQDKGYRRSKQESA